MKRKQTQPIDTGPTERQQHNKVAIERDINNRPRLRVLDQLEIDRLLLARKITMDQHTAAEHLYRDITNAGYYASCNWNFDRSHCSATPAGISNRRSMNLLRVAFARSWLEAKASSRARRILFRVVLDGQRVTDRELPLLRLALDKYQAFESHWNGLDTSIGIPALLLEMPGDVQSQKPRPFHDQMG